MMNKQILKNTVLILVFAAIIFNTFTSGVLIVWMNQDRKSLKKVEADIRDLKDTLETEINLRENLYPELKKSAKLLKKYNPTLDDLTTVRYAYKIFQCSDEYVSPDILTALIVVESSADFEAESSKGALGLTQVMPNIWKYDKETLKNPYKNIEAGSSILSYYVKKHGLKGGLSAYNSGQKSGSPRYASKVIRIAGTYF
jgi:soluble lytic murein transglycosylase-like protein